MFFSTPIDLYKWNAAEWRGMLYLFYPGAVPVLGLLYRNYAAAKSIFTDWKKTAKDKWVLRLTDEENGSTNECVGLINCES